MTSHLLIRISIETELIVDLAEGQSSSKEKLNTRQKNQLVTLRKKQIQENYEVNLQNDHM